MPVAAVIAVAVAWWGNQGLVAQQPVTWQWGINPVPGCVGPAVVGCAQLGSYHVQLNREAWDANTGIERCVLVIHELGHAAFSLEHQAGTVMDAGGWPYEHPPGVCRQFRNAERPRPGRRTRGRSGVLLGKDRKIRGRSG